MYYHYIQWDTAGQERFRTITTSYYKGAQGIVIVYDITDNESFDHVKNWMADIDKFAKEGVLRLLVGNKSDLAQKRQVPIEKGQELALAYGIKFMETSAKETVNIEELFVDTTKTYLDKQLKTVMSSTNNNKGTKYSSSNAININSYPPKDKKRKKKWC